MIEHPYFTCIFFVLGHFLGYQVQGHLLRIKVIYFSFDISRSPVPVSVTWQQVEGMSILQKVILFIIILGCSVTDVQATIPCHQFDTSSQHCVILIGIYI